MGSQIDENALISENSVCEVWEMYERARDYQNALKLTTQIKENIDFFEGRQWPAPTEATRTLPRPITNYVKFICRNKRALLTSVPVRLVYKTKTEGIDASQFTNFAEYISREMRLNELDAIAVKDAVIKGSYCYHFYWDTEGIGLEANEDGALRCEVIDVRSVYFANPCEKDEQKQKWIIIPQRVPVDSVKETADDDVDKELIAADEQDEYTLEQEGSELCTVLIRYFRKDGEVFFEKAVKGTIVNKATPIAPDYTGTARKLGVADVSNNSLPDNPRLHKNKVGGDPSPKRLKASLYPIVFGSYEEREDSIYGISEAEGLIPNQKAINFNTAMQLMAVEAVSWGKYVVKRDALQGQEITNEAGQVLVDYSNDQYGIRKLDPPQVNSMPLMVLKNMVESTRSVSGASEVLTGEISRSGNSGVAIAQLQAQATQPIEELRERFWRVKEKQGLVMAQFFKLFYRDKRFSYTDVHDNETNEEKQETIYANFDGSQYENASFSIIVEATKGVRSSAASDIQMLDIMFQKGAIDSLTYVRSYPSDMLRDKAAIERLVKEGQESQVAQMGQQISQLEEQLEQAASLLEKQSKVIDDVSVITRQNNDLRAIVAKLYAEATSKIDSANLMAKQYGQVYEDASEFASIIERMAGEEAAEI